MRMKQKSLLIGFLSLFLIPSALADLGQTLNNVWWKIMSIGNLSFLGMSDGSVVVALTRILIGILVFTIFYAVIVMLSSGKKPTLPFVKNNQALVIALIVAIISAIFLPAQVLLAAGTGWATLIALLLIGAPIVTIALLFLKIPNEPCPYLLLKTIIGLLIFWILSAMRFHVGRMAPLKNTVIYSVDNFIYYALIIITILTIYYFVRWLLCLLGHLSGTNSNGVFGRSHGGESGNGFSNPFKYAKVRGKIEDADSHVPLKSKISLKRGNKTIKSKNFTGSYSFSFISPGDYQIISNPFDNSYNSLTNSLTLGNKDNKESDFFHKKDSSSSPSSSSSSPSEKESKIHGIIVDKENNSPIETKVSLIKDGHRIRYKNYTGRYELDKLETGGYEIISQPVDSKYKAITKRIILGDNESKEVDFLHEASEEGKSKFYGTVKSSGGNKIKSKVFLLESGHLIKEYNSDGDYEFLDLAPGNYNLVSKPKNKKFSEITKDESLAVNQTKEVNFVHKSNSSDGDDKKSYKWRNYLFSLVDYLEKKVIRTLEDNSGDVTKHIKKAKKHWGQAKAKMSVAIKLAEDYFNEIEATRELTPEVKADIKNLLKRLTQTRKIMDYKTTNMFDFNNREQTAKQIRVQFTFNLGELKKLTGELVKKISKMPLKS